VMNPVDIVADQFKGAGIAAQYKRRCKDGTLEDASEKELEVLKVQSRIAAAAQQLQHASPLERTTWAVEIKDYANALYSQGINPFIITLSGDDVADWLSVAIFTELAAEWRSHFSAFWKILFAILSSFATKSSLTWTTLLMYGLSQLQ
jgi:hypothetical protein